MSAAAHELNAKKWTRRLIELLARKARDRDGKPAFENPSGVTATATTASRRMKMFTGTRQSVIGIRGIEVVLTNWVLRSMQRYVIRVRVPVFYLSVYFHMYFL